VSLPVGAVVGGVQVKPVCVAKSEHVAWSRNAKLRRGKRGEISAGGCQKGRYTLCRQLLGQKSVRLG